MTVSRDAVYEAVLSNLPNAVVALYDRDLRLEMVKGELLASDPTPPADMIGRLLRDLVPPEQYEVLGPPHEAALQGEASDFEYCSHATGRTYHVHLAPLRVDEEIVGVLALSRSVTEQRKAEGELRESERRLAEAQHVAKVGSWERDLRSDLVRWSDQLFRIIGLEPGGCRPSLASFQSFVHESDREAFLAAVDETHASGRPYSLTMRVARADGTERWVETRGELVRDEAGLPTFIRGTVQDITERRNAEEELRQIHVALRDRTAAELAASERRLAEAQAMARLGTWEWDLAGDRVVRSVESLRLLGLADGDLTCSRDSFLASVHPDDRENVRHHIRQSIDGGFAGGDYHYRIIRPDGEIRTMAGVFEVLRNTSGTVTGARGTTQDITEEVRAREELRARTEEAERLARERAELFARLIDTEEAERRRIAANIHDDAIQAMSALGLRVDILTESRRDPVPLRLADEVRHMVDVVNNRLRQLVFELRPDVLDRAGLVAALRVVLCDLSTSYAFEGELVGGLANEPPPDIRVVIYRVAVEAMQNAAKHARPDSVRVRVAERGGGAWIEISDDGAGFDVRSQPPGRLGIQLMRERVTFAGGWIEIASEWARGTSVQFWLPSVRENAES